MNTLVENYELAKKNYAEYGIDTEGAMVQLSRIPISIHAWQGDDVTGFEKTGHALTGGCQVTGSYPGRAGNAEELRQDLDFAMELIPGVKKVCLQAHEVDRMLPGIDRDAFTINHFSDWLNWAKSRGIGLDIAPAFYSHPKLDHGLSLSHPDPAIRRFWIDHGKVIRKIGAEFGKVLSIPCICNFWMPDGFKDTPADRLSPRLRMAEALDEIFAEELPEEYLIDAVESKLFGIGTESYTVVSHDFCLEYTSRRNKMVCLDSGHFHPTESVADKISSILALEGKILLHVSRGVRWDSDHVVLLNDELTAIGREVIRCGCDERLALCLDYFDASINRVAAWVIGARNLRKSLLIALLEPYDQINGCEKTFDFTGRLAAQEAARELPWNAVWQMYCVRNDVPVYDDFMNDIRQYEQDVLSGR